LDDPTGEDPYVDVFGRERYDLYGNYISPYEREEQAGSFDDSQSFDGKVVHDLQGRPHELNNSDFSGSFRLVQMNYIWDNNNNKMFGEPTYFFECTAGEGSEDLVLQYMEV
jgi:hypothetical protein